MVEDDERHRVARHRPSALDVDIVAVLEGRAEEDRVGIGLAPVRDKVRGGRGVARRAHFGLAMLILVRACAGPCFWLYASMKVCRRCKWVWGMTGRSHMKAR